MNTILNGFYSLCDSLNKTSFYITAVYLIEFYAFLC